MKTPRTKFHREDLDELFAGARKVLVGSGRKHVVFDPRKDAMDDIAEKALGRSGTLRAPSARVGTTWLVGWNEDMWSEVL